MADAGMSAPLMDSRQAESRDTVELDAKDLHGPGAAVCPNPRMKLWASHPRVFIDVGSTGEGKCAYCGTVYRLRGGAQHGGGH